jgi:hypothetical protein
MADLGSWGFFAKVSIQPSEVPSDRTGFPVYVDLSDLDATFFNEVQSDGADIRVTESDRSTLVPREVESIDTGAQTGELWFKAPSLSSSNVTDFYVFFGNASASAPAVTDPNGRNAVWSDYAGVWHNGATEDSTGNFGAPSQNTVTPGGATGQIGDATAYSSGDQVRYPSNTALDFGTGDFHISAWLQVGGTPDGGAVIDLYTGDSSGGFMLKWRNGMSLLTADGPNGYNQNFGNNFSNNELHHFLVARESSGRKRQYVDGVEDLNYTLTARDVTNNSAIYLGRSPFNSDSWRGILDEIRVAPTAPSADWAKTENNNTNSPSTFYNVAASESDGFSGSGTGTAQGSGQITRRRGFSGEGVGTAQGFGSLNRIPLAGSGVARALGNDATLRINRPLSGSGVATAQGDGELNLKSTMGGSGEAQASGQGDLNVRVSFEGSGVGRAQGSVKLTGARVFGGAGVAEAFGSGELGDIKAHWVFVNGNVESEDAGASLNVTGLDPSVVHVFQVAALDTGYNFSVPATLRVSPLSVSKTQGDTTSQTIKVETPGPDLHDEIELYRSPSQGGPYTKIHVFSAPQETQEYLDAGLSPGTNYFYQARGVEADSAVDVQSEEQPIATSYLANIEIGPQSGAISGYPLYLPLSEMPSEFWSSWGPGRRIEVFDNTGSRLPVDRVYVDPANQQGQVYLKSNLNTSRNTELFLEVRSGAETDSSDSFGRDAVWSRFEAVWLMREDPSSTSGAFDVTGNGREARFDGSMDSSDLIDGPIGKAYDLDGSDDQLAVQNFPLNDEYSELTAQVWFRATSTGILLSWDRNEYFRMEIAGSQSNGNFGTSFQTAGGDTVDNLNASSQFTDGNWHRGTFVYDNGTAKLFVDGSQEDSQSEGSRLGSTTVRHGLFATNSEESSDGSSDRSPDYGGDIGESRVALTALSGAEVKASYENQTSPSSFLSVRTGGTWNGTYESKTKNSTNVEVRYRKYSKADRIELETAGSQNGSYSLLTTFSNPSLLNRYTYTGLAADTTYWFRATAYDADGNVIGSSNKFSIATEPAFEGTLNLDSYSAGDTITSGGTIGVSGINPVVAGDADHISGKVYKSNNQGNHNSQSGVTWSLNPSSQKTLAFDWEVSSEGNFDHLEVYVDGNRQLYKSGDQNGRFSTTLSAGSHTIEIFYSKDGSVSNRQDTARWGNVAYN